MQSIITGVDLATSPEKVWEVLTGFVDYPAWNPYLRKIEGSLGEGQTLQVTLQPERGAARMFERRVVSVIPGEELAWESKILSPWFFRGHHIFRVRAVDDNTTHFENIEHFSGLLVPLVWRWVHPKIRSRFEAMNGALQDVLLRG